MDHKNIIKDQFYFFVNKTDQGTFFVDYGKCISVLPKIGPKDYFTVGLLDNNIKNSAAGIAEREYDYIFSTAEKINTVVNNSNLIFDQIKDIMDYLMPIMEKTQLLFSHSALIECCKQSLLFGYDFLL